MVKYSIRRFVRDLASRCDLTCPYPRERQTRERTADEGQVNCSIIFSFGPCPSLLSDLSLSAWCFPIRLVPDQRAQFPSARDRSNIRFAASFETWPLAVI